ncbi:hypothetical protein [Caloranaerobacter azorensis]|nr:hypothetical protein [Caloranaerobacter azorensis]
MGKTNIMLLISLRFVVLEKWVSCYRITKLACKLKERYVDG